MELSAERTAKLLDEIETITVNVTSFLDENVCMIFLDKKSFKDRGESFSYKKI